METITKTETWDDRIKREREEREQKIKACYAKALLIAKALNYECEPMQDLKEDTYSFRCSLKSGDASIYLTTGFYGQAWDKLHVSGDYPRGVKGEYVHVYGVYTNDSPINVSMNKTPERIASDIQKRFIPSYVERLKLVLERINEDKKYNDTTNWLLASLKALLSKEPLTDHEKDRKSFSEYLGENCSGLRVEGKVSRKIADITISNLNKEQAHKLIELLKSFKA